MEVTDLGCHSLEAKMPSITSPFLDRNPEGKAVEGRRQRRFYSLVSGHTLNNNRVVSKEILMSNHIGLIAHTPASGKARCNSGASSQASYGVQYTE